MSQVCVLFINSTFKAFSRIVSMLQVDACTDCKFAKRFALPTFRSYMVHNEKYRLTRCSMSGVYPGSMRTKSWTLSFGAVLEECLARSDLRLMLNGRCGFEHSANIRSLSRRWTSSRLILSLLHPHQTPSSSTIYPALLLHSSEKS